MKTTYWSLIFCQNWKSLDVRRWVRNDCGCQERRSQSMWKAQRVWKDLFVGLLCQEFNGGMSPERAHSREESDEERSVKAQKWERTLKAESKLSRDLMNPESSLEIHFFAVRLQVRSFRICITDILKKLSGDGSELRSPTFRLIQLLIQYDWKVFTKPSKSLFWNLNFYH